MHSLIMCVSSVSSFSVHPCLLHTQTLFQMWSNAVYIYNVYHTIINHFHFNSVFNIQNRTRQYFCMNYIDHACMHKQILQISSIKYDIVMKVIKAMEVMKVMRIYAFLCISLHFIAFLFLSLHFPSFLYIFLHFSTFLCISLHFSAFCISIF